MTIAKEPTIPRKFRERQSGYTTALLGECITNLALGQPCIFIVHATNNFHYVMNLARTIAVDRGFLECREKMQHKFALKNGGAELTFMSIYDERVLAVWPEGLAVRASKLPLFVDHYVWECRAAWPPNLKRPVFYAEPHFHPQFSQ